MTNAMQEKMNIFREQYKLDKVSCQIHNLPEIYHEHFGNLTNGTFVEVGAFDCHNWSNTFMLAELGWSGVYIEPNPQYFQKCLERYKDHPRISLVNLAIGCEVKVTKLYIGGSLTTIKKEAVKVYKELDWAKSSRLDLTRFIECGVERLDNVLEKLEIRPRFDVLVIDVEGAEEDVMKGFNLAKWKPKLAIVEAHEEMAEATLNWKAAMFDKYFIEQNNYRKIHVDTINNVYIYD